MSYLSMFVCQKNGWNVESYGICTAFYTIILFRRTLTKFILTTKKQENLWNKNHHEILVTKTEGNCTVQLKQIKERLILFCEKMKSKK